MVERDFGDCVQLVVRTLAVEPDQSLPRKYLTLAMQVTIAIPRQSGLVHDMDRALYGMNFRESGRVQPPVTGPDQAAAQWIELDKKYPLARRGHLRVRQRPLSRDETRLWRWTELESTAELTAVLTWMVNAGLLERRSGPMDPVGDRGRMEVVRLTEWAATRTEELLAQDLHVGGPESVLGAFLFQGWDASRLAWTARRDERRGRRRERSERRRRSHGSGVLGMDPSGPRGIFARVGERIGRRREREDRRSDWP